MHNNYIVRKSFHTLIAGSFLEVHCRSSQEEKVINIHDISGRTVDERACGPRDQNTEKINFQLGNFFVFSFVSTSSFPHSSSLLPPASITRARLDR